MKTKLFQFKIKNLIFASIFGFFTSILSLISNVWNPFTTLDNKLTDSIFQHESQSAKEIYLVGIDDETIEKYGSYNAIEYRHADVLNDWAANDVKPSAIGFDIIFNKAYGCDEVDINLANAMKKHNVVLGDIK